MNIHSLPVFPQELFEIILNYLSDDFDALIACSRVCPAWAPTTRKHIFYDAAVCGQIWDECWDIMRHHAHRLRVDASDFPEPLLNENLDKIFFLLLAGDSLASPYLSKLPRKFNRVTTLEI